MVQRWPQVKTNICFSPLHEGDTSVAQAKTPHSVFASGVSVPFTRGTPPWPASAPVSTIATCPFQSPSRGGHLRGGYKPSTKDPRNLRFSPLHEGDTSVAIKVETMREFRQSVSVPFTRGTPPWPGAEQPARAGAVVSVPFTRGTPPWPLHISCSHIGLYAQQSAKSAQIAFLLGILANPRGFVYHTSAQ